LAYWVGILALLLVHFGFAALLGGLIRQVKTPGGRVVATLGTLGYLGSGLTAPLDELPKLGFLLASLAVFVYQANGSISTVLPTRQLWLYAGMAMLLILMWTSTQGWDSPSVMLGAAAAWAGILAWRRGLGLSGSG
jgi:hypothetical protein